jgi:integrase
MSLTKLDPNKWHVRCQVWDKNKGYSISKQVTVTGTRAEAVIVEADILKELKARSLTSAYASTFGEAVNIYVENLCILGKLSERHQRMIDFIRRELGHIRLEAFADHFGSYRKRLINSPTKQGKPRKSASINRYTEITKAVFNHLVRLEIVDKNPITNVQFPRLKEKSRDRYLTQEERLALLAAIQEHRPYILPIIRFMLMAVCRKGELVTAKREQYSPFTHTIKIPHTKAGIPVDKPVPPEMDAYFKSIPIDCPWLFYEETAPGKYRPLTHLRYAWAFCLKKAGLSDLRIHDLRHISATDLYAAGVPEREIMDQAGWKTPMLSRYRHVDSLRSAQKVRAMWEQANSAPQSGGKLAFSS